MLFLISDHAGFSKKESSKKILENLKIDFLDLTPEYDKNDDYPKVAFLLAEKMNECDFGIAFCGSGRGICMALNRFSKIRAGYVENSFDAKLIRKDNDSNVLCLSGEYSKNQKTNEEMQHIINTFLKTEKSNEARHLRRINQLRNFGS